MVRYMNTLAGFIVNGQLPDQKEQPEPQSHVRRAALNKGIFLFALVAVGVLMLVLAGCEVGEGTILTVDDSGGAEYTRIQDAVDDAGEGDRIMVSPGTYYETITIETTLELVGSSPEDTIINGSREGDVVTVNATDVLITGFNITGSGTKSGDAAIQVKAQGCEIEGILATGNADGVIMGSYKNGRLTNSTITNNTKIAVTVGNGYVFNNTLTHNKRGISTGGGSVIDRNNCSYCQVQGIGVGGSGNRITRNICNYVEDTGIGLWDASGNTFLNNEVSYGSNVGIIVYGYSEGNRFENCTVNYNKYYGMKFGDSKYNKIKNCTFRGNDRGLQFLSYSNSNKIHSCNIFESATMGLHAVSDKDKNNATGNWWGDPSGPYHSSANPDGKGDNVSSHITFDPWLEEMVVQKAKAVIVSPGEGSATEGTLVKFQGETENYVPVQRYVWRSSLEGELYNGSGASFTSSELICGEHEIFLKVQDSYGAWSEEVSTNLLILPCCDYNPGLNPSPLSLSTGEQWSPSVSGDIISWQDDRCGEWDIFMFDFKSPTEVTQLSVPSATIGADQWETHMQKSPLVAEGMVVWLYEWWDFYQHNYYFFGYDTASPIYGGTSLHSLDDFPVFMESSGDWVVWTEYDFGGGLFTPFSLKAYSMESDSTSDIDDIAGDFGLDGSQVAYFREPGSVVLGEETMFLTIHDLDTAAPETELEMPGDTLDIEEVSLSGSVVVWEDHRKDESGFAEDGNSDIYFLDLESENLCQLTVDTGTQEDPDIDGDTIVWVDKRSGEARVYAYSISRDKTAVLSSPGVSCEDPRVSGNRVVWSQEGAGENALVYVYELSLASWQESEAVFSKLEEPGGDGPGPGEDAAPLPVWEKGDTWKWSGVELDENEEQVEMELTETVVDTGVMKSVWGQQEICYEIDVSLHWLGNDTSEEYTIWYAENDFTPEGEDWCGLTLFLWILDFPFGAGDCWDELECTGRDNISVEGKNYDCFVVDYGSMTTIWYSPELKHVVQVEGDGFSYELSSSNLLDSREDTATSYYSFSNVLFLAPLLLFGVGLGVCVGTMKRAAMTNGLMTTGLVLVVVGLVLALALVPVITEDGEAYDSWIQESPELGESMWVSGFIETEEEIPLFGESVYVYQLEGSEEGFLSTQDLGDEGSFIIVVLEVTEMGVEARSAPSPWLMAAPGLGLILTGTVLALVGAKKAGRGPVGRKENKKKNKVVEEFTGFDDLLGPSPGAASILPLLDVLMVTNVTVKPMDGIQETTIVDDSDEKNSSDEKEKDKKVKRKWTPLKVAKWATIICVIVCAVCAMIWDYTTTWLENFEPEYEWDSGHKEYKPTLGDQVIIDRAELIINITKWLGRISFLGIFYSYYQFWKIRKELEASES